MYVYCIKTIDRDFHYVATTKNLGHMQTEIAEWNRVEPTQFTGLLCDRIDNMRNEFFKTKNNIMFRWRAIVSITHVENAVFA